MNETSEGVARGRVEAKGAAPIVRVTRRLHFSAAHRLSRSDWTDERNRETFGLCSNPNWHGHNYEIDVTVEGPIDAETGYVLDLKALRDMVEARVIGDLDHRNLNLDVSWLEGVNPTTENLVVAIWDRLAGGMPATIRLVRLVLYETPRNYVEYTGRDWTE
jgi:6-pyruvoyltetrahydropterin/6-carboxytetrahydropterin synthase